MRSSPPDPLPCPSTMQPTYDAVVALTDGFCRDHLTEVSRSRASHDRFTLSQAPKPVGLGAAAHLGLRDHPRIGPTKLPVGQGEPASHDHG